MSNRIYGNDLYRDVLIEVEQYGRKATKAETEIIKATCLIVARILRERDGGDRV